MAPSWIMPSFRICQSISAGAVFGNCPASNPNYAQAYNARGWFRVWDGGSDAAIADFEQAMRFSPRDPFSFTSMIGIACGHFIAGRHAEAAIWADRSIRSFPYFIAGLTTAIACYVEAGRWRTLKRPKRTFSGFRLGGVSFQ